MGKKSPHTVAHRRSLAYRIFKRAADCRDLFLGRSYKGDYLPTLQKYFTGISLRRYVLLVCVEYPMVLLISIFTWAVLLFLPCYMIGVALVNINSGAWDPIRALVALLAFLVATVCIIGLLFFVRAILIAWAESEPGIIAMIYKQRRYSGRDPDFDDFPEKFPGPIALLKKWILSTDSGESSKITWDSGKKRAGW